MKKLSFILVWKIALINDPPVAKPNKVLRDVYMYVEKQW